MRVLLIEDDKAISQSIELMLRAEGFNVYTTDLGEEGAELGKLYDYDIILLDLNLPDISGHDVLKNLRVSKISTPVLVLSGLAGIDDKVRSLGFGADDYLTKPFGVRELMARVRALIRRGSTAREQGDGSRPVTYKHIEIDPSRRAVKAGERQVELTTNEFQLLYVLLSNPGIVFSREALLRKVWKDDTFVTVRSVDTLVKRVRKKIEDDPAEPSVILTVWGAGYKAADV